MTELMNWVAWTALSSLPELFSLFPFHFLPILPTIPFLRPVLAWIWWWEYPSLRREMIDKCWAVEMDFIVVVRCQEAVETISTGQIDTNKVTWHCLLFPQLFFCLLLEYNKRNSGKIMETQKTAQWMRISFGPVLHEFRFKRIFQKQANIGAVFWATVNVLRVNILSL